MAASPPPPTAVDVDELARAAVGVGHRADALELLRIGSNHVYADRASRLVFRVCPDQGQADVIAHHNRIINRLAAGGAPILPPVDIEPLQLGDSHLATVWPLGDPAPKNPTGVLAPTLIGLHRSPADRDLDPADGFRRARNRLACVSDGADLAVAELSARLDELQHRFPSWVPSQVVHGDAHLGNIVIIDNRPLLIDLDDLANGCAEIDLAPTLVSYRRFNPDGTFDKFLDAYGHPIDAEVLEAFAELRQLTMLSWLATLWDERPESRAELQYRIDTIDTAGEWRPL